MLEICSLLYARIFQFGFHQHIIPTPLNPFASVLGEIQFISAQHLKCAENY